jgi:signal transduction histidine kinase
MKAGYTVLGGVGVGSLLVAVVLDPSGNFPWTVPATVTLAVGLVLAHRVPRNPVGWLLASSGTGMWLAFAIIAAATGDWLHTAADVLATISVFGLSATLLRFPDGNLPSRRWRPLWWAQGLGVVLGGAAALLNGGWGGDVAQGGGSSPLYEATKPLGDVLSQSFFPILMVGFVGSGISLIVRYRSSRGEERLQIKWLAFSAGLVIVTFVLMFVSSGGAAATRFFWQEMAVAVAFASVPLAVGVAVLRYRLYDIDSVLSRAITTALVGAFITATYATVVVGLGSLFGSGDGELLLPIVGTAVVAVAFEPVRLGAVRWANRLVFGQTVTPYEVLSEVIGRLSHAEDDDRLIARLAVLLRDATGAQRALVWLGDETSMELAAASPPTDEPSSPPALDGDDVFPAIHSGELVGALQVIGVRGGALSSVERELVSGLAGSAAAVLGHRWLNESLAARAADLEASRARLMEVQDAERKRLERDLHEGAEQYIVALKVKLGVASQLAGRHGATDLTRVLDELAGEAQAALDDVRSLAKGVYPAVLESEGLGKAVADLARSAPVEVVVDRQGLQRYPSEIEATAYFVISEAVTNAVKHGVPPIEVTLTDTEGALEFEVRDQGPGFDIEDLDEGSGLANMADRLEAVGGALVIESSPGSPTRVIGRVVPARVG